jgi:sec-independent protein translocase protein TatA
MEAAQMGFSTTHLLILGFVALLLFGNRLPSVMRSLGKSVSEFKKGLDEVQSDVKSSMDQVKYEPAPTAPAGDAHPVSGAHETARTSPQGDPFVAASGQSAAIEPVAAAARAGAATRQGDAPGSPAGSASASPTGPS